MNVWSIPASGGLEEAGARSEPKANEAHKARGGHGNLYAPAMARLILIRHGESVANAERRFTHGPHEPLSRKGRDEALARARLIAATADPVALYASPFVRALETARLIGSVLGLDPTIVEALQEQDFGTLRGEPYDA